MREYNIASIRVILHLTRTSLFYQILNSFQLGMPSFFQTLEIRTSLSPLLWIIWVMALSLLRLLWIHRVCIHLIHIHFFFFLLVKRGFNMNIWCEVNTSMRMWTTANTIGKYEYKILLAFDFYNYRNNMLWLLKWTANSRVLRSCCSTNLLSVKWQIPIPDFEAEWGTHKSIH